MLSVAEAAQVLGLSERTVQVRLQRRVMRGDRIGKRLWVIPRAEVDRWLPVGRRKPGPKSKEGSKEGSDVS